MKQNMEKIKKKTKYFFDHFWGWEINGKATQQVFWKIKFWSKKSFFFGTVNRLKNTSDCIKIDPPGPGRNLKKKSKKNENMTPNFDHFLVFTVKNICFWEKKVFKGKPLRAALKGNP